MNNRLKEIRKTEGMNQHDFAEKLGIGQSTLAMMEVGKRKITERHIKTICSICHVNEEWFRTGAGNPYCHNKKSILEILSEQYHLSDLESKVIFCYLQLDSENRACIKGYVDRLVEEMDLKIATENSEKLVPIPFVKDAPVSSETPADYEAEKNKLGERGKKLTEDQFDLEKRRGLQALSVQEFDAG